MKEKIYKWLFNYLLTNSEYVDSIFASLKAEKRYLSEQLEAANLKIKKLEEPKEGACTCTPDAKPKRKYNRKKKTANNDKA
jgi:hypothetical protein